MEGSLAERRVEFVAEPLPQSDRNRAKDTSERVGVIGLGYVGLPVAMALADKYQDVTGFDLNPRRVSTLREASDWTNEVSELSLLTTDLNLTARIADLTGCTAFVVAVPTPVSAGNIPDFDPLVQACRSLAPLMNRGSLVVFESTVHPGATEEICAPILEEYSGLVLGVDFDVAYSPERISPGDHQRGLTEITKIVSAQSPTALDRVAAIYEKIVPAGVHRTPSIKVAEAAKVFENTQRDVNIALMNKFSLICEKLGIRTHDVISATATK